MDYTVRAFARLMAQDHIRIASRLAALLKAEQFQAPHGIGPEGHRIITKLGALPAAEFDRQFMAHQIKDHEHDLEHFQTISSETRNASIREFVDQTHTVLAQQLALAKAVEASLKRRAGVRSART